MSINSSQENAESREHSQQPPFMPLFIFCLLILGYQGRDALVDPQFWAEDGAIFFQGQLGHFTPMLFKPYAGYLHVVPRLVAWLASAWDYQYQPSIMNTAAWLIAAWAIAFTARRLDRYVPVALTLSIVAFVPTSGEITGSITNIQWFLQLALVAITMVPARKPMKSWSAFGLTLLMALTGPFSVFVLGVAVVLGAMIIAMPGNILAPTVSRVAAYLRSLDRAALAGLVLGAVAQGIAIAVLPSKEGIAHGPLFQALSYFSGALFPIHLIGEQLIAPMAWIFIYACVFTLFLTGKNISLHAKLAVFVFAVVGVTVALAGVTHLSQPYDMRFEFSDRYYLLSKFAFWWMLYIAFAGHWLDRSNAAICVGLAVIFIGTMSPQLHRRWAFADLQWKLHAQELKMPGRHSIPINPAPFSIEVDTDASGKPSGLPTN